ncbi:hypothetical protein C8A05DRAFT_47229 [Staphylotrichum tortipilum]|uniref:DUF7896 domain-containing protein n=1 Tax=Staphylotrichum tortipilum TaxID=2831512 RepID=A0AAN6RQ87_9PEZI|nr:hypothetical protein C8A05DRAFT_47229 [Staphylotrichum longicolle]
MSQHDLPDQLWARLEKNNRERLELLEAINRAKSFAPPSLAPGSQSRPMKRSKTHGAPMMRSKSTITRPGPLHTPFVYKGPGPVSPVGQFAAPVMKNSLSTPGAAAPGDYLLPNQAPFPVSAFAQHNAPIVGPTQHAEFGREMQVEDFISMREDMFPVTAPISIPLSPANQTDQYPSSSFPSVCGSMTSGPTLETAPMSRRGSAMNDGASISSQFEMVRIQSQQSNMWQQDGSFRTSPTATRPRSFLGKRSSEDSGVVIGNSFSYLSPSTAPALPFTNPVASQLRSHPMEISFSQSSMQSISSAEPSPHELTGPLLAEHLSMERSASKDSIKSNSSLKQRAKVTLARQNYAAKARQLQPRPAPGTITQDILDPIESSAKDGKTAIAKTKYERPKHPKVVCNQCNEHPEGFRGEHELRRHTHAKHKSMVKKFVCRDPALLDIPHSETPAKSLKECKKCENQKQYGAYYNAAAHLRRTHFNVRPRKGTAGAKDKADEEKEKRGGKGGGDWPPMNELKLWMVEITVPMDQDGALGPDGAESVGAVDREDQEAETVESEYNSQQAVQSMPMIPASSDTTFLAGLGGGLDLAGASFHGDLDSHLADLYYGSDAVLVDASALQGLPISSAGFDHLNPGLPSPLGSQLGSPLGTQLGTQPIMGAPMMGLDGHGYTSPVSSSATITQAAVYMDQLLPPGVLQMAPDELAELPFDLTFATTNQDELFAQGN